MYKMPHQGCWSTMSNILVRHNNRKRYESSKMHTTRLPLSKVVVYLRVQKSRAGARVVGAYAWSTFDYQYHFQREDKYQKNNRRYEHFWPFSFTCVYKSSIVPAFPAGNIVKTSRLRQSRNQDGRSLRISAICQNFCKIAQLHCLIKCKKWW